MVVSNQVPPYNLWNLKLSLICSWRQKSFENECTTAITELIFVHKHKIQTVNCLNFLCLTSFDYSFYVDCAFCQMIFLYQLNFTFLHRNTKSVTLTYLDNFGNIFLHFQSFNLPCSDFITSYWLTQIIMSFYNFDMQRFHDFFSKSDLFSSNSNRYSVIIWWNFSESSQILL